MRYIGVDLHKRTLSVCVTAREEGRRVVLARKTLRCSDMEGIRQFLEAQRPCRIVLEATSSYEWFVALAEPIAERTVLAHPTKMRVIAESTRKTDKLDAQVLAEFLLQDMVPESHRPSPRVREHRDSAFSQRAKVLGLTMVMSSLIALPRPRPALRSRCRSSGVTVIRLGSLSRRIRFSAFK